MCFPVDVHGFRQVESPFVAHAIAFDVGWSVGREFSRTAFLEFTFHGVAAVSPIVNDPKYRVIVIGYDIPWLGVRLCIQVAYAKAPKDDSNDE